MNLTSMLRQRAADGKPVRAALIGAGKFGSMFLSQVPTTPGMHLAGIADPAVDGMIDAMLAAHSSEAFQAAARALDRLLAAGRYVIPIWQYDAAFIAHVQELKYPDHIPIYGDRATYFLPEVWWIEP